MTFNNILLIIMITLTKGNFGVSGPVMYSSTLEVPIIYRINNTPMTDGNTSTTIDTTPTYDYGMFSDYGTMYWDEPHADYPSFYYLKMTNSNKQYIFTPFIYFIALILTQ